MPDTAEATVHWDSAERPAAPPAAPMPPMGTALWRGARARCPSCGKSPLFAGWLKPVESCPDCAAPLGQVRADDAPPYFTIFAVGHVVVPGMLWLEKAQAPELWVHAAIWLPLTLALSLSLMRPVKGATIGLMLKLGFGRSHA